MGSLEFYAEGKQGGESIIIDKDTANAIVDILDRRITRLQLDQDEAREKGKDNDLTEAGFRRQEAELIRQTIFFGGY